MMVRIWITCDLCGTKHAVRADTEQLKAWENGETVQQALPDLDPVERDQLVTSLCPTCQQKAGL